MAFTLYYHPLASYCWKVLIALYEHQLQFEATIVDLSNAEERAALERLWPLMKFPVLVEDGKVVPESTIIVEYLESGGAKLIPTEPKAALETRFLDRFFDQQIHEPMQKHVGDKLRPADKRDPYGVEQAHEQIDKGYDVLEKRLNGRAWAAGDTFSLADCAAAPALYYANRVHPLTSARPWLSAYLERLHARPSFARVFSEAGPYLHFFPG
jgi:glutathione S-transferase